MIINYKLLQQESSASVMATGKHKHSGSMMELISTQSRKFYSIYRLPPTGCEMKALYWLYIILSSIPPEQTAMRSGINPSFLITATAE